MLLVVAIHFALGISSYTAIFSTGRYISTNDHSAAKRLVPPVDAESVGTTRRAIA